MNILTNDLFERVIKRADDMLGENLSYFSRRNLKKIIINRSFKRNLFFWNNGVLSWALNDVSIETPQNTKLLKKKKKYELVDDSLFYYANYENISSEDMDLVIESLLKLARNSKNSILYRSKDENVYIDALGMVPQLLIRYGFENSRKDCIQLGIIQFDAFIKYAIDSISGLPYHAYNSNSGLKMGIVGWGRSLGWILVGLSESMRYLPEQSRDFRKIESYFKDILSLTMKFQSEAGGFGWQIQSQDAPLDVSATSMIGYAISRYNDTADQKIFEKELDYLCDFVLSNIAKDGRVLNSSAECRGLSMYPQVYENNAWGQAFAILLIRTMKRAK